MSKDESFVVGSATMCCGECGQDVPVEVSMWVDGDRLVAEPDMTGLYLHTWAHREAEKT